jgi:gluconokinase
MDRMLKRSGHFMKATMLDSQLNTLENPAGEEGVMVSVDQLKI